jgi:hypothetical protein
MYTLPTYAMDGSVCTLRIVIQRICSRKQLEGEILYFLQKEGVQAKHNHLFISTLYTATVEGKSRVSR